MPLCIHKWDKVKYNPITEELIHKRLVVHPKIPHKSKIKKEYSGIIMTTKRWSSVCAKCGTIGYRYTKDGFTPEIQNGITKIETTKIFKKAIDRR